MGRARTLPVLQFLVMTIENTPITKGMTLWFIPQGAKTHKAGVVIDTHEQCQLVKIQHGSPLKSQWEKSSLCKLSEPKKETTK